jgi:hypothetical protein
MAVDSAMANYKIALHAQESGGWVAEIRRSADVMH